MPSRLEVPPCHCATGVTVEGLQSEQLDALSVASGPRDRSPVEGGEEPVTGVLPPGRDLSS